MLEDKTKSLQISFALQMVLPPSYEQHNVCCVSGIPVMEIKCTRGESVKLILLQTWKEMLCHLKAVCPLVADSKERRD